VQIGGIGYVNIPKLVAARLILCIVTNCFQSKKESDLLLLTADGLGKAEVYRDWH